jgi:hypothetical protein
MLRLDSYSDKTILFSVLAVEAVLLWSFYTREIAWYPPMGFDQTSYLTDAYRLQERILGHGFGEIWQVIKSRNHANGLLLPIEGALAGIVLGGARWPQLALNFLFFGVLQVFAFYTARTIWGHRHYGYAVVGLILCQATGWLPFGGLVDFRIDFSAYCLYGIWACAVVRSKLFLDRYWAVGCGLIGALLVLNRFLTVIYLVGVCAGFGVVCVSAAFLLRANADLARGMWQRFYNLCLSAGVFSCIVGPVLVLNWRAMYNYYVGFHVLSEEKYIPAAEMGIKDLVGHLIFYPRSIVWDHWGQAFLFGSAITIASAVAARYLGRSGSLGPKSESYRNETFLLQVIFLSGAILGPVIVLTADISKSAITGGIVGVPAALLVVALAAGVTSRFRGSEWFLLRSKLLVASSVIVLALGLLNQFNWAGRHRQEFSQRRDLRRLIELERWLVNYAIEHGWHNPAVSFDVISGWLNSGTITTTGFEQSRDLVEFHPLLGWTSMAVGRQEALSLLSNSDFVILTDLKKTGVRPFYADVARYWGDLKAWADENMILTKTARFDSFTASVYTRPTAMLTVLPGGWLTRDGLSIEAPRTALQRFPVIRLVGEADYSRLPKVPAVTATIDMATGVQSVRASFRRVDNGYEILIDTSSLISLPATENLSIRLCFSTFFVPKILGIPGHSDDERELVVRAPTLVQLLRTKS